MKVCDICPIKICSLSKDCNCELKEFEKPLDVKISVEGNLTVITGKSVKVALQKWKKRAILKELKTKCHTNGWIDEDKAIYLKGRHEHTLILQILQPFLFFSLCNTCYIIEMFKSFEIRVTFMTKYLLIYDIPREKKGLRTKVFRVLTATKAKMIQHSIWQSSDLKLLKEVANLIKKEGGNAGILEEKVVY